MSKLFTESECLAIAASAAGHPVFSPAQQPASVTGVSGAGLVIAGWLMPSGRFQGDQPVGYNDHDRAVCALAIPLYRVAG